MSYVSGEIWTADPQILFSPSGAKVSNNAFIDKYNVKYYGAVGDGTTDDTDAFIAGFSAVNSLFVPDGTYLLSDTLTTPTNSLLFGHNRNSVINSTADLAIDVGDQSNIQNIGLKYTGANDTTSIGFQFSSSTNWASISSCGFPFSSEVPAFAVSHSGGSYNKILNSNMRGKIYGLNLTGGSILSSCNTYFSTNANPADAVISIANSSNNNFVNIVCRSVNSVASSAFKISGTSSANIITNLTNTQISQVLDSTSALNPASNFLLYASYYSFTAGTPADWNTAPTSIQDSINRIASAVVALQGGSPIA